MVESLIEKIGQDVTVDRVFEVYKAMYLWQSHKKSVDDINLESILNASIAMVSYFEQETKRT